MTESIEATVRRLNRPFLAVLRAQERYVKAEMKLEDAREARDRAIRHASAAGFTRRSLAQATSLTPGRIQQIVDRGREER